MIFVLLLICIGYLNDICDGCTAGYYGELCSKECPKFCHDNECNVTSGKCLSCVGGYYSDINNDCTPCPAHCTVCSSKTYCYACKSGFRGKVCDEICNNCKPNTSCDKLTGYCFDNCREGLSGELCNTQCASKCKSCDRHNKHVCISCADGGLGKVCKEECLTQCLRSTCKESHESCAYECSSGSRANKTCNQTCLSHCKDRDCNITCEEIAPLDRPKSSTSKANIGLIMGPVIGSIAIICLCSIGFLLVRRRNTKRRKSTFGDTKSTPAKDNEDIELLSHAERRTTKIIEFPSAENLTVLCMQESFSAIEKKYGDIIIKVEGNKVTIEGDPLSTENAFKEMQIQYEKVEHVQFEHHKSRQCINFYQKEQTVKYVKRKLKQKQLHGIWYINGTELTVYVFGKGNSENFKNTLLGSVLEICVPVNESSTYLLSSEWWGTFLSDMKKIFQEKVDIFIQEQQYIIIIGTDDVVQQVAQLAKEFLDGKTDAIMCAPDVYEFVSNCWTQDDFDDIRKTGVMIKREGNTLELRGLLDNLFKGKKELNKKLNEIKRNNYVVKKPGIATVLEAVKHSGTLNDIATECRCVIKLSHEIDERPSTRLCDYEVIDSEMLKEKRTDSSTNANPKCFQTKRHEIKIQLIQGDIARQKADIIVVGAASNIDLQSGSAFDTLLKQGGPRLRTNYNKLYPYGIQDGDIAVLDSGGLFCDKIYLTSLPPWNEARCGKVLRNFMRECLRLADKYDKSTIAFSNTVSGVSLGYPLDMAVSIVYGAVIEFDSSYSNTSLKEVNIVANEDDKSIMAFEEHEHIRIYGASAVGSLSTDFVGGRITIELVSGELSTQQVDATVCILPDDEHLNISPIYKNLFENGGDSFQDECKKKCKNKLGDGKVVGISGGKLPCKTVFLTVLSTFSENNSAKQSLITILQTIFKLANSKGSKSLAIPVLENSFLKYPETTAAKCMYDAVIDWAHKNQNASLKVVRFVMYGENTDAQQIYRMCHLKMQGRENRNKRVLLEYGTNLIEPEKNSKYGMVKDGCAIGPIQLQVQVGELLNNSADAIVIGVSANSEAQESVLDQGKCVMAGNGEPKAKLMIHVLFQNSLAGWRSKLVDCLADAGQKSNRSIAVPLLGSGAGQNSFPADRVGTCLFAAIDDFVSLKPKSSVTEVRLVLPDTKAGCIPAIFAALQARITALNFQWGIGKIFKSHLGTKQFKESSVTIYSDASNNLDRCIQTLVDTLGLEFCTKVVDADMDVISSLQDEQMSIIDADIVVDSILDKQTGNIRIFGPLRNVLAASTCIHNKIEQYKEEENSRNSAKVLYDETRWHWLCENQVASEEEEIPYDSLSNFLIETAYKKGKQTVELQYKDGTIYAIDFQKLVEYRKTNTNDNVMLIRKDILKDVKISIPQKMWMAVTDSVKVVALVNDEKYKKVEKRFLEEVRNGLHACKVKRSQSVQVVKIESIQNRTLYQQYTSKKKRIEQQTVKSKDVEHQLWYGTTEGNIKRIVNNGFNRSYGGLNGVDHGQGVYFAADASFALQFHFAENKPKTKRYIFLAKVLTGELIKGNPSMRVLPPVNPAEPSITYDSAVDDIKNPTEFVIFHVTQAYPKYLITYITE